MRKYVIPIIGAIVIIVLAVAVFRFTAKKVSESPFETQAVETASAETTPEIVVHNEGEDKVNIDDLDVSVDTPTYETIGTTEIVETDANGNEVVETIQETEESLEIADNKENSVTSIETQSYGTNILESLQYASDDVSSALNIDYDLRSCPDMIELIKYPDKYIGKLCYVYGFAAGIQDLGNVSEQYGNNLTGGNEIHVVRVILDIVNMKKHYLAFDTLMRAADIREFNMMINNPDGGKLIYGCLGRVYTTDQDNCFFINGASDIYKRKPANADSYYYCKRFGCIDEEHNIYE